MKAISLSLSLNDQNFAGLGRRKYTEKYTQIPVSAYPEQVVSVFTALYKLIDQELNNETASLSVLASAEGYPQRLIGPKVFQVDGELGVKIGSTFHKFTKEVSDDEIKYTLNGKVATLQSEDKTPLFKLAVGGGMSIKLPIYCNYGEDLNDGAGGYYDFKALEEAFSVLDNAELVKKMIGAPSSGGGNTVFTSLRNLPAGVYNVSSTKNGAGKYGPTLEILVTSDQTLEILTQQKNPATEKWEEIASVVEPNTVIKIQGNTSLRNSLMGSELTKADNVTLHIVSQEKNKEGKIVVSAFFDYENSPTLKFEF